MSEANKGREVSAETREKISKSLMGNIVSDETRAKQSESHKGQKQTPEQIERFRERMTGDSNPSKRPEVRQKISETLTGHEVSDETRQRQSDAARGKRKGESNPSWKGGKAKCPDCGVEVTNYGIKRCAACSKQYAVGQNAKHWTGGKPKCVDCGVELTTYHRSSKSDEI
jgi:predicted RNA-binding Zn-ribbon protein involved in translation (DUF1610 family)